ncbi:MAG: hypothetical protein KC535_00900 [Nanoarchaeota archaeon]|nr:hypothetical protein [Nanoarchaeota archaeon]
MKPSTFIKPLTYAVAGIANGIHIASHIYISALGITGHHHDHNIIFEYSERILHHPLGQAAAISFLPLMIYDQVQHRKHHQTIKKQKERIEELETLLE